MRLLIATLVLIVQARALAMPLECDDGTFNFGSLMSGSEVEHDYLIWNRGDVPVEIFSLNSCCGVKTSLSSNTVIPGSNIICSVIFNTNSRQGKQVRRIYLNTNIKKQPKLELVIIGDLYRLLSMSSTVLTPQITIGEDWQREIVIENHTELLITLENIDCEVMGLHAKAIDIREKRWVIRVWANSEMVAGEVRGWVRLEFSSGTERIAILGKAAN